jgi:hypothetical protein
LVNVCPFAHTRNRFWERRDGAPQQPQGTVASNPIVFLATAVVTALSAGFLPISPLRRWLYRARRQRRVKPAGGAVKIS